MRKSPSLLPSRTPHVVEIRDRTTLLPGDAPLINAPSLGLVIDCLFALRADPADGHSQRQLGAMAMQGEACCPACGDDIDLTGFRRTRTDYAMRDEWICSGCDQRFLLGEENVC